MEKCRKCAKDMPDGAPFCPWCGAKQVVTRAKKRRGNGLGTVYHNGQSWVAEWTRGYKVVPNEDGTQKKLRVAGRKKGFKRKAEAEAYLRKALEGLTGKKAQSFQELFATYSTNEMLKKAESTQRAYNIAWRRITPVSFASIDMVTIDDLQGVIDGLTYEQAKDIKNLLSNLYRLAIAQKYTTVNLSKFVTLPENNPKETTRLDSDEVTTLWNEYNGGDLFAGYFLLMVYSGMMPGELMQLKKDMIIWDKHIIVGVGSKTKERKSKPIVFPEFITPVLRALCDASPSKNGKVLAMSRDSFYATFNERKKEWGLRPEITPYSSRRATGSELAIKGVPPAVITDVMRHRTYETTLKYYTKIADQDALEAVNKMAHPEASKKDVTGGVIES